MYPDEFLSAIKDKFITQYMRIAFFSSLIAGCIAHLYMMTNKLPNYDDIRCLTAYGTGFESGRFSLGILGSIIKRIFGNYSMPWFNGLISVILVSMAAALLVSVLKIRSKTGCFLCGALMVSFPAFTGTMFFMYTVQYYSLGILLSVISVLLTERCRYGILYAIITLTGALGIYQAYYPIAAAAFLLLIIQACLAGDELQLIIKKIFKYALVLVLALILYLICSKIIIRILGMEMTAYQNINEMGMLDFKSLPSLIWLTYSSYFGLMYREICGLNAYSIMKIAICLTNILIVYGYVKEIAELYQTMKDKKGFVIKCVIGSICIVLFPVIVNAIYIMNQGAGVYSIMLFPVVFLYILLIIILENHHSVTIRSQYKIWVNWLGSGALTLILFSQCFYSNMQYLAMDMQFKQAYSYYTTMVTQIKMVDGYRNDMPAIIVGDQIEDESFYENDDMPDTLSGRSSSLLNIYSRNYFLKYYLGFNQIVLDESEDMSHLREFREMPVYPEYGSIKVIDQKIVVKLES